MELESSVQQLLYRLRNPYQDLTFISLLSQMTHTEAGVAFWPND